jgi:hypothetical protein
MEFRHGYWATFSATGLSLLIAVPSMALGQTRQSEASHPNHAAHPRSPTPSAESGAYAQTDLDNCRVHRVTGLPGSHQFAGDFIETIATDPGATDPDLIWGLTADLSDQVPFEDRAMYISKSTNRGATWTQVARLNSRYLDAAIGEGIFNGLTVAPGGTYFVITTQRGAFQVIPQPGTSEPLVKPIAGPLVPSSPPKLRIAKKPGDPVRANVVGMTADGTHLIIGYGYFDLDPKLFSYRKDQNGSWVEDGPLPPPPTEMDLLSMQFDDPKNPDPGFVYLGTGDQVYLLNLHTKRWSLVDGVGPDSAIHGMSVVGGLHLAACWGIYNPAGPGMVRRVTTARFLLHRSTDETGSNLRAYSIDVDPLKPNREVVASLTGVYATDDRGRTWTRISGLPEEEFRSAHINSDGTVLVSGIAGTFLVNPFSDACPPQLHLRDK